MKTSTSWRALKELLGALDPFTELIEKKDLRQSTLPEQPLTSIPLPLMVVPHIVASYLYFKEIYVQPDLSAHQRIKERKNRPHWVQCLSIPGYLPPLNRHLQRMNSLPVLTALHEKYVEEFIRLDERAEA